MIDVVGLFPYSESLSILKLTRLIESRTRGDPIEAFQADKGLSGLNKILADQV